MACEFIQMQMNKVSHETIPPASQLFIGREDYLHKLAAYFCLRNKSHPRRHFLLYGMEGVGKTQICLKFVEEQSDR
jgi:Cdc6-like AAA superfamily ATPase